MTPHIPQSLPWINPLSLAASLQEETHLVLLYSSAQAAYSGRYSLLAYGLAEHIIGNDFEALEGCVYTGGGGIPQRWFGYFGYGLKNALEALKDDTPSPVTLPNAQWMRFKHLYQFDHQEKTCQLWSDKPPLLTPATLPEWQGKVAQVNASLRREEYLAAVAETVLHIEAGALYQANITRKFHGAFSGTLNYFALFCRLMAISPAPYSAYMRIGDAHILSASPEQFLKVSAQGKIITQPIKGTRPRGKSKLTDSDYYQELEASEKDKAENLMIVDLMRNDLSKVAEPASVRTERLFDIHSHSHVHHLSSTITAQKARVCSTLDVIKACFPPGSMTGAPKISAMKLCSALERFNRGVYSGALGWLGGDGSAELSVVIRTLVCKGNTFEFQVGGGIVADSLPEEERQETMHKAAGIVQALGLTSKECGF